MYYEAARRNVSGLIVEHYSSDKKYGSLESPGRHSTAPQALFCPSQNSPADSRHSLGTRDTVFLPFGDVMHSIQYARPTNERCKYGLRH
jgi:hypothetical protein